MKKPNTASTLLAMLAGAGPTMLTAVAASIGLTTLTAVTALPARANMAPPPPSAVSPDQYDHTNTAPFRMANVPVPTWWDSVQPSPWLRDQQMAPGKTLEQRKTNAANSWLQEYLTGFNKRVKKQWKKPPHQAPIAVVTCKIWASGNVTDIKVQRKHKKDPHAAAEEAAVEALQAAAPVKPLSYGAPSAVKVRITFDPKQDSPTTQVIAALSPGQETFKDDN